MSYLRPKKGSPRAMEGKYYVNNRKYLKIRIVPIFFSIILFLKSVQIHNPVIGTYLRTIPISSSTLLLTSISKMSMTNYYFWGLRHQWCYHPFRASFLCFYACSPKLILMLDDMHEKLFLSPVCVSDETLLLHVGAVVGAAAAADVGAFGEPAFSDLSNVP